MKTTDLLPPIEQYRANLYRAASVFKLSIDDCRKKFGLFTIGQWENLFKNG